MKRNACVRKILAVGLLAFIILAGPGTPLRAEEENPTGDFSTSVLSGYVWRGYELSRNSVVVQPSMTIGYKGFTANVWGNLDTKAYSAGTADYPGTWNETDLTLSYSKSVGPVTLGGGYIYYSLASLNRDAADRLDSQEFFVSVAGNMLLTPTLTIYKEIDHYRQWYFLFGVSHVFELSKAVSLKLAASASYLLSTDETPYPKCDENAMPTSEKFSNFHDGTVSASLPIKVSDHITLTPAVSYIFPLSGTAKDEMKYFGFKGTTLNSERDSAFLVGGLTASFSF